jgi:phage protein D/phage baseplate assembly protein gpV
VAEQRRLDAVQLTVEGRPLAAELYALLTLVRVEESVQLPDAFTLRFDDPHFELFDRGTFALGTSVDIALRAEGDPVVVTNGEITAIVVEPGAGGRHELVLTGFDVTHRLARGPRTRSFQQMTDADIAGQIAADHGLDTDIEATREVHEYVLQTSQTDYAFLRQRADRIGFDLWISDKTFFFKPRPRAAAAPPTLRWGENLQKFKVRFSSADRCDEVTVRGWDAVAKRAVVGRATEGDLGSTAPAAEELAGSARDAFGQVARFAGQFPVATQAEADALASSLLLKASGGEVVLRGEARGDPMLAAGAEVTLERVGARLAGRYRLTSVEHVYGSGTPYVTRFVSGGKDPASMADLLGGGPAGGESRRGWGSLVVGVVTNADDPERLGRVKVKFPSLTEDDESAWARLVAPGGGVERGLQCVPEVGDEVLVGFELGDTRRPLVIGGLWNREDPPPDPDTVKGGEVQARVWRSRNGHRLELRDEQKGAATLELGDAGSFLRLTKAETSLQGEQKLVVEAQEVELRATKSLAIKAPQVEISADAQLKLSGKPIKLN